MNTTNDQPAADYATLRILTDNQAEDIERLHAKIAALESQLEAHAWKISPAMAQAQIDALNAQIYRLRAALIKIAYMTRHEWSASVAVEALEGQP